MKIRRRLRVSKNIIDRRFDPAESKPEIKPRKPKKPIDPNLPKAKPHKTPPSAVQTPPPTRHLVKKPKKRTPL